MELSIVIVSYNSREHLGRCLQALPAGASGVRWEVLVVDNASHDGSAEMVAREFPDVRLIGNRDNLGFARACNQGIRAGRGQAFLFLNPDAVPVRGALAALHDYLSSHGRVGAVGPQLRRPDGGYSRSCFRFPSVLRPFLNFRLIRRFAGERFGLAYPVEDVRVREGGPVDWLSGACLLVRRRALEAAGLFDERYFMYFEDTDLCRRLWRAGWEVVYWPGAQVFHVGGASAEGQEARLGIELQRSRFIYFSTHHPGLVYGAVRCMAGIAAAARSVRWLASRRIERLRVEGRILRLALRGVEG